MMDISTLPAQISEIYIQVVTSSPSFLKSKTPGWARRLSSLALDLFILGTIQWNLILGGRDHQHPPSSFLFFVFSLVFFCSFFLSFVLSFLSLSLSYIYIYIYYYITTLVCLKIAYVQFQWIIITIPIEIVGRIPLTHPYYIYIHIQFILSHAHTNTESSTRRWARGVCAGRSTSAATKPRSMAILVGNDPHNPTYVRDDMGDKCKKIRCVCSMYWSADWYMSIYIYNYIGFPEIEI